MAERRRNLTHQELLAAAETLQVALLDGIVRARRWGKSELAFQGGTCLHLAYGSPRASEDLDFIVASDKGLEAIMQAAVVHARAYVRHSVGPDASLEVKSRGDASGDDEPRNPRIFTVTLKTPAYLQALKVKAEFYVTAPRLAAAYASDVRAARLSQEAQMRRPIGLAISQAIVPAGRLTEIFADKIYALAARPYLKHRDVFDLWWLDQQGARLEGNALVRALQARCALYPNGPQDTAVLAGALNARAGEIVTARHVDALALDMRRWLALAGGDSLGAPGYARSVAQAAADHARAAAEALGAAAVAKRTRKRKP